MILKMKKINHKSCKLAKTKSFNNNLKIMIKSLNLFLIAMIQIVVTLQSNQIPNEEDADMMTQVMTSPIINP